MILDTNFDSMAKPKLMKSIIVRNVFQYKLFYFIPATRVKWNLKVTKLFKINYIIYTKNNNNNDSNNQQSYGGIAFLLQCSAAWNMKTRMKCS